MTAPLRFDDLPMASDSTRRSVSFDDIPIAKPAAAKPKPSLSVLEEAKGLARSLGQGVLMGFGEELESIPYMLPGGETREEALRRIRGEMSQYRQERPLVSTGAEIVGGMATGVAGGARALAAGAGRRAAGAILGSAIGQGAISGAGAAEGDITDRLTGAAIGGTAGAALPYVGGKAVRLLTPAARQIGEAAQAGYDVTRRGMANLLEGTPMQRVGRAIEPTDITRIQREATVLPGSVTGPTAAMMPGGNEAVVQAVRQAEAAAAQAQQQVKFARLATSQAKQARAQALEEVGTEEGARVALGRQRLRALGAQAEETERIGKGRRETLTATAKAAEEEAKQLQRESAAQLRETEAATRQQVQSARLATSQAREAAQEQIDQVRMEEGARVALGRQRQRAFGAQAEKAERIGKSRRERLLETAGAEETEAERILREARQAARAVDRGGVQAATAAEQSVIQQAEDQAQTFLQRLRVQKGTTKSAQKTIRKKKDEVAAANYKTLYGFGSPDEEAQWALYDEMKDIPGMMPGLRQAAAELRVKGQALGQAPNTIRRMVGTGETASVQEMPELTVELFDKFRQIAREGRVPLPNETGARAQSKMFYKDVVDQFEDQLFGVLPEGAREAAQVARKEHRAFFRLLEAAEDGLNLGVAKPGKVSGLLTQNKRELDEVVERVGKMSDQEREVFQTAAREAIDRQIQRSQGEASKVLQRFGSEEMQQKLRLAYGDTMVDDLQALALGQVKQQAKAAGTAAKTQAQSEAQRLRAEAEAAVAPIVTRAERARSLGERARTQGQERARTMREESLAELEGRRSAGQMRLAQTQRAVGALVQQARQAQRTAQEQAAQVAEQLTQAQIARRWEEAATPLTARAERARALAERARTQGQERAQALREEARTELEGRVQAGQLRLAQTQRATGAPVRQAREAQRATEEQAAQLAEQLTQARIARSQAKALPVGDLERALGPSTAQQTFLQRTLPQMSSEQRTQAVQVLGSNVQRRLQDLARQGESPERILREINLLKQNDAVRTLFGPQIDAFAASLFPTIGTRIPGSVRPALTGALSRAGSSFFGIGAQETPE